MNLIKKYINKCIVKYENDMQARAAVAGFYSNGIIDSIKKQQEKEKQIYNKLEIDDLKLRICVLEGQVKEFIEAYVTPWYSRRIPDIVVDDKKTNPMKSKIRKANETKTK